jgi:formate hydrogenlyase subunit 6/NADH:ubiquinone oxidoreductase subunit I
MRLAAMLGEVLRSLVARPATRRYPVERAATPERLRGKLRWRAAGCTGCALCVKDCPANALDLIVIDKAAKRFAMRYDAARCTYCGQCIQSCRFKCFAASPEDWELAALNREGFTVIYGHDEEDGPSAERRPAAVATDAAASAER